MPKIYPTKSDYATAINNPKIAFRKKDPKTKIDEDLDSILVNGKPFKIPSPSNPNIHLPWSASGGFACVFKYQTSNPNKFWAVRCFNQSTSTFDTHYKKVSHYLKNIPCTDYFIDFTFLDEGIRVNGNIYPLLRMEWVEGKDLKSFIKDNLNDPSRLIELGKAWLKLSKELHDSGIAHGDLQHGNILIDELNGGINIKLIDYDSLYFAQDGNSIDDEIKGVEGYQHPLRDSLQKQCLQIDFFSQWVILISIFALAQEPILWQKYNLDNTERLLFSRKDFEDPEYAEIFDDLYQIDPKLTDYFREICQLTKFDDIPSPASALEPDDPIDVTDVFTSSSSKTNINVSPPTPPTDVTDVFTSSSQNQSNSVSNPSSYVDTTNIFTGVSQNSGTNQTQANNISSQPLDATNIFTKNTQQIISQQPTSVVKQLKSENTSLTNKVSVLDKKLGYLSKLAIITTIIATTLAGLSFFQHQERNQMIKQIERLRQQNKLSPGQMNLSSYSFKSEWQKFINLIQGEKVLSPMNIELELKNFNNIIKGKKTLVAIDLDDLIDEMQKKTHI